MANVPRSTSESGDTNHRDPMSGEPGAHPIGVGVGAASGGAIGAGIGAAAGPLGAAVGAGIGAVAGAWLGKEVAEAVDPTVEEAYWRANYTSRPYVTPGDAYDDYHPAYRYGWESASLHRGVAFDEIEPDLHRSWYDSDERSRVSWEQARDAARDAWDRIGARMM